MKDIRKLRKVLEKSHDKLKIFSNQRKFNKYYFEFEELLELIKEFLSDNEILKLFDYTYFQCLYNGYKIELIKLISDENILLQILNDENITDNFYNVDVMPIIEQLSDSRKQQILNDEAFMKKYEFSEFQIKEIISSLGDEAKVQILSNIELIKDNIQLGNYTIAGLISETSDNDEKLRIMEEYQLDKQYKVLILSRFDIIGLIELVNNNKEFLVKHNIYPFEIVEELSGEKQKGFIEKLEEMELTLNEKKAILAVLKEEVKQNIDISNFPEEYKIAISIQTRNGEIIFDSERDIEDYRGLDYLMARPEKFTEEQRSKFKQVCDISPNLQVIDSAFYSWGYSCTASEYKEAEEWIESLIKGLKPEYSKAQKLAIIDNAIGKKVSYSPDDDTEIYNDNDSRSIWKVVSSGYGICGGIARLEKYILDRVGIEAEVVYSETHAFLEVKDIELPFANGEIVKGNTIVDPTWNLAEHRFGGKPENFCVSYETIRKSDIDEDKKDHECHKNDEELKDITLELDKQSLRELFRSVGLADEYGRFPIYKLIEMSKILHSIYENQPTENINKQLLLLSISCPEFATCQNSSMRVLSTGLLNNKNLKFNRCVVHRVYNRSDKQKRPVMYVYINLAGGEKKFYFADKEEKIFKELSEEEFVKQFECYENDLEKNNRT